MHGFLQGPFFPKVDNTISFPDVRWIAFYVVIYPMQERIQDFFQEGVHSSLPINHIVFFAEYQLDQKTAGHLRGLGAHPLHPPPRSASDIITSENRRQGEKFRLSQTNKSVIQKFLAFLENQKFLGNICSFEQLFYRKKVVVCP